MREVPLALDGQQAVLEGDLYLVGLDAGKLDRNQVGVLALGYVDRRRPGRGGCTAGELLAGAPAVSPGRPQHLVLRGTQILEQVPAGHDCHAFSLASGRAGGPATRKNTAQVNTIQFRATVFTVE